MKKLFFYPSILILTLFITLDVNAACENKFDLSKFNSYYGTSVAQYSAYPVTFGCSSNRYLCQIDFRIRDLEPNTDYTISYDSSSSLENHKACIKILSSSSTSLFDSCTSTPTNYTFNSKTYSYVSVYLMNYDDDNVEPNENIATFDNIKIYKASETCDEEIPPVNPDDSTSDDSTGDTSGESVPLNNTYLILIAAILMLIFMTNFIKSCFKRRS